MDTRIIEEFDNVIDVISQFESNHPVVGSYTTGSKIARGNSSFEMFEDNGKIIILPRNGISTRYYRGEPEIYPSCKSSINRLDSLQRKIAEIKKIEFIDILKTFPATSYAEKDGHLVDYEALAQHYEMKSNVIDLTSDIVVAAFFATNRFNEETNEYTPVETGSGVIWFYNYSMQRNLLDGRFRFTGLQPFKRTEEQCAFSFYLKDNEDFSNFAHKVHFKQNPTIGNFIKNLFINDGKLTLFPEEKVAEISSKLRNANSIFYDSFRKFKNCEINEIDEDFFKENQVDIRSDVIFTLTEEEKKLMQTEVEEKPFGDKFVTFRLSYRP